MTQDRDELIDIVRKVEKYFVEDTDNGKGAHFLFVRNDDKSLSIANKDHLILFIFAREQSIREEYETKISKATSLLLSVRKERYSIDEACEAVIALDKALGILK